MRITGRSQSKRSSVGSLRFEIGFVTERSLKWNCFVASLGPGQYVQCLDIIIGFFGTQWNKTISLCHRAPGNIFNASISYRRFFGYTMW